MCSVENKQNRICLLETCKQCERRRKYWFLELSPFFKEFLKALSSRGHKNTGSFCKGSNV